MRATSCESDRETPKKVFECQWVSNNLIKTKGLIAFSLEATQMIMRLRPAPHLSRSKSFDTVCNKLIRLELHVPVRTGTRITTAQRPRSTFIRLSSKTRAWTRQLPLCHTLRWTITCLLWKMKIRASLLSNSRSKVSSGPAIGSMFSASSVNLKLRREQRSLRRTLSRILS